MTIDCECDMIENNLSMIQLINEVITPEATISFITEEYYKENISLYLDEDYYCEITRYVNMPKLRKNVKDQLQPDAKLRFVFAMSYRNPLMNRKLINLKTPYKKPCAVDAEDAGSYYKTYEGNRMCVADYPVGDCIVVYNTEESRRPQKEKYEKRKLAKKAKEQEDINQAV